MTTAPKHRPRLQPKTIGRGEGRYRSTAISKLAALAFFLMCSIARAVPAAAFPLPEEDTLHPGIGLVIASDSSTICTAGFVAHNARGAPVMFTAGHCDTGGVVEINSRAAKGMVPVGEFVATEYGGNRGEQTDVAVMKLSGAVPLSTAVDGYTVTGTLPSVYIGMPLCKIGITTGRSCGPVVSATGSKVKFAAQVAGGDSGGPVYAIKEDGTAVAVGITIRTSDSDGMPVAELISPWLDRWGLSIT